MFEVRQYVDRAGRDSFGRWFDKLDDRTQARLTVSLDRFERGNDSTAKSIGGGLHELRMDFGPGYRIYFGRDGAQLIILVCGGTKRRQQTDIQRARELWEEYKQLKKEQLCH